MTTPTKCVCEKCMEAERFYQQQKDDFVTDLKLVIRKHFRRGNEALPLDEGGDPADYGFLNDDDMAALLSEAAQRVASEAIRYLYMIPPLSRRMTAKESKEWLKTLMENDD